MGIIASIAVSGLATGLTAGLMAKDSGNEKNIGHTASSSHTKNKSSATTARSKTFKGDSFPGNIIHKDSIEDYVPLTSAEELAFKDSNTVDPDTEGFWPTGVTFYYEQFVKNVYANWNYWFSYVPNKNKRMLEVGSREGSATVWAALKSLEKPASFDIVETVSSVTGAPLQPFIIHNLLQNLKLVPSPRLTLGMSCFALPNLAVCNTDCNSYQYDIIYIDGSHNADDVFLDLLWAWQMLNVKGILIIDDYHYNPGFIDTDDALSPYTPKRAVNVFMHLIAGEWTPLHYVSNQKSQVCVQKTVETPQRIFTKENKSYKCVSEANLVWNSLRTTRFPLPSVD